MAITPGTTISGREDNAADNHAFGGTTWLQVTVPAWCVVCQVINRGAASMWCSFDDLTDGGTPGGSEGEVEIAAGDFITVNFPRSASGRPHSGPTETAFFLRAEAASDRVDFLMSSVRPGGE